MTDAAATGPPAGDDSGPLTPGTTGRRGGGGSPAPSEEHPAPPLQEAGGEAKPDPTSGLQSALRECGSTQPPSAIPPNPCQASCPRQPEERVPPHALANEHERSHFHSNVLAGGGTGCGGRVLHGNGWGKSEAEPDRPESWGGPGSLPLNLQATKDRGIPGQGGAGFEHTHRCWNSLNALPASHREREELLEQSASN